MPHAAEPVGPFPPGRDPEDYDRMRRRVLWSMPAGLYVVGSHHEGRYNAMTANWVGQVATAPKLVGVSVEADAVTCGLVRAGGAFTVNLLAREDRSLVRRFVKPAHHDPGEASLNGFAFRPASSGAPVLEVAVAWLDCRVQRAVELGSHVLFLGEVVDAGFARAEDTPLLRMEDTRMSYGG